MPESWCSRSRSRWWRRSCPGWRPPARIEGRRRGRTESRLARDFRSASAAARVRRCASGVQPPARGDRRACWCRDSTACVGRAWLRPPRCRYGIGRFVARRIHAATGRVFARELLARVRGLPGARRPPGGSDAGTRRHEPGGTVRPRRVAAEWAAILLRELDDCESGLFRDVRILCIAGRDFTDDDRQGTQAVAIVGEGTARRLWPGKDAVGQTLFVHTPSPAGPAPPPTPLTVVGVVGDVAFEGFAASRRLVCTCRCSSDTCQG